MDDRERAEVERGAAWLQRLIAQNERDPVRAQLFADLAGASDEQAGMLADALSPYQPTWRHRTVGWLVRHLGPKACRPLLAALKVRGISVYGAPKAVSGHLPPTAGTDFGAEHRAAGGGSLRAGVFGANDGLISNTCLIMGVAGATATPQTVLLTGIAGLLAGAFSMAAGEYVSVRSQREMFEYQIAQERDELDHYPEEEAEELALIYAARGVDLEDARKLTRRLLADPEAMLATLAREELGLNPDDLGSPWGAALSSFTAFSIGAIVPLAPFAFGAGASSIYLSAGLAAACLFLIGGALSLFSGRSFLLGGLRMLLIGAFAGAATFGIGSLVGGSLT